MAVSLRDYQQDAVNAVRAQFAAGKRRPLLVAPTGAGKTVMFSHVGAGAVAKRRRTYFIAHREEIIDQIGRALRTEGLRHGWIAAGRAMTDDLAHVAMVNTLAGRISKIPRPDFLVIDEAHHGISPTYRRILDAWPDVPVLGVTATPGRPDGEPMNAVFDSMVETIPMRDLIARGALARYRYLAPPVRVDLSAVRTRAGDYAIDDLAAAMDRSTITGDAVAHYEKHLPGAPSVVFCCSVAHAEHVAEQFRAAGWPAAAVDGKLDRAERKRRMNGLADGSLRVITSCDLISEGVDVPGIVGAFLLRPTKSVIIYLQQVGRALRLKPDGGHAVILDHAGNVHSHGLPDAPREWSLDGTVKRKKEREITTSTCETCYRTFETYPGWKAEVDCTGAETGCILNVTSAPRATPKHEDGELADIADSPEWAGGLNVKTASGEQWKTLLRRARTREELDEIARIRGLKHGWSRHIIAARERRGVATPDRRARSGHSGPDSGGDHEQEGRDVLAQ